jgi:hypothetical protein
VPPKNANVFNFAGVKQVLQVAAKIAVAKNLKRNLQKSNKMQKNKDTGL